MTHKSSFNIRNADDYFIQFLLPQYRDFIDNNASSRHALLTIIVSYHLFEWIHKDKFTIKLFEENYPSQKDLAKDFEIARNITNGTKHFSNDSAKTSTQRGFSSDFSDEFARSLNIEYPDGTKTSVDILLRRIVNFWQGEKDKGSF